MSMLDIARWLATHGFHVFPLTPHGKRPLKNCPRCTDNACGDTSTCGCLHRDRPCHGLLAATTDVDLIDRWWTHTPRAGVGIHCGRSRLVVLDLDRKDKPPAPAAPDVPATVADGLGAFGALCRHAGTGSRGGVPRTV